MLSYENTLRAPSIRMRLPAQRIRILLFLIAVAVIGVYSWGQVRRVLEGILISWIVINAVIWAWEFSLLFPRSPALLTGSETKILHRHTTRIMAFIIAVLLNFALMIAIGRSSPDRAAPLILMVAIYNLLTLAWLEYSALRWFQWPKIELMLSASSLFWLAVSLVFGGVVYVSLESAQTAQEIDLGMGIMAAAVSAIVFIMQRLEVEDRAQAEVIHNLSNKLLGVDQPSEQWNEIVRVIGEGLRYKRVHILEPILDEGKLKIVGQYGDGPNVSGKDVPIDVGITGRSFRTGEILAWNDVRKCDYYYGLHDEAGNDTRSEIAIPIQYLGIPYGVLDVQDTQTGVFSRQDIRSLEVIARILGAALSAQKSDILVEDAYKLWEELSSESYNEEDIFRQFAKFARRKWGADLIGYYPLSPAGYPISAPIVEGTLHEPERMNSPILRMDSMLFTLIQEWRPQFIESVEDNPLLSGYDPQEPSRFTVREGIRSVCFMPIGTPKERLGALFLNFRQARRFDGLFKFMVLNFSQTFAMLAIRNRYRSILVEGYGRPELGIHNLFSRYGLKIGVVEEGAKIFENSCRHEESRSFSDCGMLQLLKRVDSFLYAASMVDASIPPLFWRQSLVNEVEEYASALPPSQARGPKPSTKIDIDPRIEREGAWAKLAIYRVITESMNNAVFHGATTEITVRAERQDHGIWVQVQNDGHPLQDFAEKRRSRRGIFSLLKDLEVRFRATTKIQRGTDDQGTVVDVLIPVIPLNHEV